MEFASPQKVLNVIRNLQFGYLRRLFTFAFRSYPILWGAMGLYIVSVMFEVLAMNAFIPLSEIASGREISNGNVIVRLLAVLQLNSTSSKYIFLAYIVLFSMRFLTQILSEKLLSSTTTSAMPSQFMSLALENILFDAKIADIEKQTSGHYVMLAGEEVHRACGLVATVIRFVSNALLIALYYVMISQYSPSTGVGILVFIALSGSASYGIFKKVHRLGVLTAASSRSAISILVDALNGVRSIRAFRAEEYVLAKFTQEIVPHKKRVFQIEFFSLLGKLLPTLVLTIAFGLFILISTQISKTSFNYPFAVTLLIFLMRFFLAVGDAMNVFLKIISDAKSAQDITEIVHPSQHSAAARVTSVGDASNKYAGQTLETIRTLSIKNVSFSYTGTDIILSNVSLELEQGRCYVLVGESGAGKSTLLDILLGFQTPTSGSVEMNGVPIANISSSLLRSKITLLSQETIIFNDTVRSNIGYGADISEAELHAACKLACADEIIQNLPQQYDEILQYRGTNLSGGQRQRIGLARALARTPEILILDESLSALDPTTKDNVFQNIHSAYKEKIVIFVSHDVALQEKVDAVLELKKYTQLADGEAQIVIRNNAIN